MLWIAGIDAGEQLKAAAMTSTVEMTFGPVHSMKMVISVQKPVRIMINILVLLNQEVDEFIAWFNDNSAYPDYTIPNSITSWPGNGIDGDYQFCPYYDANDDGEYNPMMEIT